MIRPRSASASCPGTRSPNSSPSRRATSRTAPASHATTSSTERSATYTAATAAPASVTAPDRTPERRLASCRSPRTSQRTDSIRADSGRLHGGPLGVGHREDGAVTEPALLARSAWDGDQFRSTPSEPGAEPFRSPAWIAGCAHRSSSPTLATPSSSNACASRSSFASVLIPVRCADARQPGPADLKGNSRVLAARPGTRIPQCRAANRRLIADPDLRERGQPVPSQLGPQRSPPPLRPGGRESRRRRNGHSSAAAIRPGIWPTRAVPAGPGNPLSTTVPILFTLDLSLSVARPVRACHVKGRYRQSGLG